MDLKPGQILIFDGVNLATIAQGDTRAKHVCMVAQDPTKLWTTGAHWFMFFGQVDAAKYLKGKKYTVAESVQPLRPEQLEIMEQTNRAMDGSFYGFGKYFWLYKADFTEGFIPFIGDKPRPFSIIKDPICSEAVGCAYWRAGIQIGAYLGKLDASALQPKTIEEEADRGVIIKKVY